jgi:hypothetical protein
MAKQNPAAGHQPLSYRDRLRLNAAIKHLKSRFHSVRIAAHKEIQAILHKRRGIKRRLREWVTRTTRTAARKVTPKPLRRVLGAQAKAAPARAKGTPVPLVKEMPAHGLRAPGGFGQTTEDLKERTRAAHRKARGKDAPAQPQGRSPAPQPARAQVNVPRKDRTAGNPAPTLQEERANRSTPLQTPAMEARDAQKRWERDYGDAAVSGRTFREPPPWARSPAPPLPAQTVDRTRQRRVRLPRLRPER